jgi:hypothetical protein
MAVKPTKVSCFATKLNLSPTGAMSVWAGHSPSEVGDPPKYQINPTTPDLDVYAQVLGKISAAIANEQDYITVNIDGGKWIVKDDAAPKKGKKAAKKPGKKGT